VGDPMQLRFVPQLSLHQERALMDAAGLGPTGRHAIAQSTNSLFEFAEGRDVAHRHFLSDQFRSDPAIVAYLNSAFYEGRLIAAQDSRHARWPDGYRPGLDWHDVRGRAGREDGGNVNHDEAEAIVQLLTGMIRERSFEGSIAVLSPFNAQVGLLQRRLRAALTEAELRGIRVSTIDRAQGSEADVVLFSTVVAAGIHAGALTFYERERRRLNVAISRARALCLVVGDRAFARASRIGSLAYLAEAVERRPKPRGEFDSEWERRLHAALKRRGIDSFPQYPVGSRSLDLAIEPEGQRLDVEVDGRRWHTDADGNRKLADHLRDQELTARGWRVRRFWVHELAADMEKCVDIVERELGRI
jgi:superfamily I DNA and/or RNA helicase